MRSPRTQPCWMANFSTADHKKLRNNLNHGFIYKNFTGIEVCCCDGRVVKALDSKSNGIFPRRFESCSQRVSHFRVVISNLFLFYLHLVSPKQMLFAMCNLPFVFFLFLFFNFHYISYLSASASQQADELREGQEKAKQKDDKVEKKRMESLRFNSS